MKKISQKRLKELLSYSPETGVFSWRVKRSNAAPPIGGAAGGLSNGYNRIEIDQKQYSAHRLVWLYVYGRWPAKQIDHINGIRNDNRMVNLREASKSQNTQNQKLRLDNKSGLKGVSFHSNGAWTSRITFNGKRVNIGYFDTKEQAHEAYIAAAKKHFGEFAKFE